MANIKLKNAKGIEQTYNGVTTIKVKDTNNNLVSFSIGGTVYSITTTLTNCTALVNNPTIIAQNGTATLGFTASSGNHLPSSITVTGASYTWDDSTGILSLSNPTGDISITITGIAPDNILENNSWETIKSACEAGNPILSTWLGQTKSTTYNGVATAFRLVDTYVGRYKFTDDNSDSHAVFEMVDCTSNEFTWGDRYSRQTYQMASIKSTYNSTNFNYLASDLQGLLKNTTVYSINVGDSNGYPALNCKIFPACIVEMVGNFTNYSNETNGGQFEYYIGKTSDSRIKFKVGQSSTQRRYWLRSPNYSRYEDGTEINASGSVEYWGKDATSVFGSVCFAF